MPIPANRVPRGASRRLSAVMRVWLESRVLELHTSRPGNIVEYDPETKRAVVQPAVDLLLDDGTVTARAPLLDVPVIHPSGGGFVCHFPLAPGDPVMLVFSDRGLTAFKEAYEKSSPDVDRLMSEADAVAIPGFGAREVSLASDEGLTIQAEDGSVSVVILPNGDVNITIPDGRNVNIGGPGGQPLATEAFVRSVFDVHFHSTPVGPSGPPVMPAPKMPGHDLTEKTLAE